MGVVVPSMSRRMPRNVGIGALSHVGRAEADGFEVAVYTTLAVFGGPSRWIQEQTDATNLLVAAQIEPVQSPTRDTNEITGLDLDANDGRCFRIDVENSPALHNKTDFVFRMDVFAAELR